ncbi:MAG: hypothetical protein OEU56_03645 [Rhodospirillales bacterium]|nr:hypothetical protein [Rhodospirillales bacterium]MDH3966097.1 hypothetical protein [Rhodospirillales bacterium]
MRRFCSILTRVSATLVVGAGLVMLAGSGPAMAVGQGDGIVGSPHDFKAEIWNFRGEICRVCHVPHDHALATQYYLNGLLWNRGVSAATYTMYNNAWSSSIDNVQSPQPDGISKLCLSCHDGTVAIDQFDTQVGGNIFMGPEYGDNRVISIFRDGSNIDLRGTHPLSIVYDDTVDTGLRPDTTTMGTSGSIADVLDFQKVQCSSCHDVHDEESVPGTNLLRVANTAAAGGEASGLCLTCHNKDNR